MLTPMSNHEPCVICRSQGAVRSATRGDYVHMCCHQCGEFKISGTALVNARSIDDSERARLSAWIVEFQPPMISSDDVEKCVRMKAPSLVIRAGRMLRHISKRFGAGKPFDYSSFSFALPDQSGGQIRPIANSLIPVGWNHDESEVRFMLYTLLRDELGYLSCAPSPDSDSLMISPKGLLSLESSPNTESFVGFCAMWFSDEVRPLFDEVIEPAIREAGYEPLRIDSKEHNNKIDDEIVASIRSARFVVADYTGERGGVYYEAGFAHGLGLPVIFMAREKTAIHFDTRQYNTIFWKPDELSDARDKLKNRILATLGRGPLKPS